MEKSEKQIRAEKELLEAIFGDPPIIEDLKLKIGKREYLPYEKYLGGKKIIKKPLEVEIKIKCNKKCVVEITKWMIRRFPNYAKVLREENKAKKHSTKLWQIQHENPNTIFTRKNT